MQCGKCVHDHYIMALLTLEGRKAWPQDQQQARARRRNSVPWGDIFEFDWYQYVHIYIYHDLLVHIQACIKYIEYGSASVGGRPCLSRVLAKTALMAVTTQIMRIFAGGRLCECSAEMHVDFRGVSFRQRGAFCVFLIDSPGWEERRWPPWPWNPLLLRNSLAPVSCKNPFRQNHFGNVSLGNFDRQLALATKKTKKLKWL